MYNTSSNFRISNFRNPMVAGLLLTIFSLSFVPSASFAQQPTATIRALSGEVLVSGQAVTVGTALRIGDTIQTQAGSSAVLELSDGSEIQLGENTQINIDDLSQTATGARVSSIKLLSGWLRALLSPGHQQEGSSFTIETPNAQLGVKFSEPDVEVSYNPAKQETVGIAHTIELMAKNLLTDEEVLVPVGSTVIIVGATIKIVAGILAIASATEAGTAGAGATEAATTETGTTSTGTSSTGSSGMGTGTKTALGVGAATAAGVAAALLIPDLLEEGCSRIQVPFLADGEVVHAPEGSRCTIDMSTGFRDDEAEAYNALSYIVFEITVDNISIQPKNTLHVTQDSNGWHVQQQFRTDKLQKGDHNVQAIVYNRKNQWTSILAFTIQVD